MLNPLHFLSALRGASVDFFTGVPDSLLKQFCAAVSDTCGDAHVIAANEGGAVALAAGHWLALVYNEELWSSQCRPPSPSSPSAWKSHSLSPSGICLDKIYR